MSGQIMFSNLFANNNKKAYENMFYFYYFADNGAITCTIKCALHKLFLRHSGEAFLRAFGGER